MHISLACYSQMILLDLCPFDKSCTDLFCNLVPVNYSAATYWFSRNLKYQK